jgi:LacI family transcriptional regulator
MMQGVYESLRGCGYNVGVEFYQNPQEQIRMLREEAEGGCSGAVIWYDPMVDRDEAYQRLREKNFPFVLVDACSKEFTGDFTGTDNVEGGNLVLDYLVKMGHRRIGYITRPVDRSSLRDRQTGVLQGAVNFGLPFGTQNVVILKHRDKQAVDDVAGAVDRILADNPGITAIIFSNDDLALPGISHLGKLGIKVPNDISVMGYDNIDRSEYEAVPLTTVMQDFYQIGKMAGEILNERIEAGIEGRGIREYVHPKLVERHSVKKLNAEGQTTNHE